MSVHDSRTMNAAEQPPASVQPPREMNEPAKREFAPGLTGSRSVRQSAPPRELPALEELMDRLVEANGSPEGDFTTEEGVLRALCGEALMPLLDYRKLLMGGGASVQESARERAKAWDRTRDPNGLLWEQHPQWYRDRLAVWLASLRPAAAPSEEPRAWAYRLARSITADRQYTDFGPLQLSFEKPNVPEGSISDLMPLGKITAADNTPKGLAKGTPKEAAAAPSEAETAHKALDVFGIARAHESGEYEFTLTERIQRLAHRGAAAALPPTLTGVLIRCREAIASLPIDALGEGSAECTAPDGEAGLMTWPLRDELLDEINRALSTSTGEPK
jgi:hypothetical protein